MSELDQLIELVKRFEGCRLKAYFCPAGVLTIGFGATGKGITIGTVWTQQQADERLRRDCSRFLIGACRLLPGVGGGAIVAAADFGYNLGLGNLKSSTFRKRLLAGDTESATTQLMRWTKAGGRALPGLVRRRQAEVALL
jgi:lysozyme